MSYRSPVRRVAHLQSGRHRHARMLGLMSVCAGALGAASLAQGTGDAARGQRLFLQCQACHSIQPGASGTVGPSLAGVVGRKAAAVPGYSYSPALGASGLTWNEATLDQWIEHPNVLVPGTKMIFAGVANPVDRAAIIAYLKKSGAPQAK